MRRCPRREEVVDGDAADGHVVDAHGRERARLLADRHHAEPAGGEIGDVVGVEGDLDEDHPVDAAVEARRRCRRPGAG